MRRARFRTSGRNFDGARDATVTISISQSHATIEVRPYRRRKVYSMPLADVAEWVIWANAKAEAKAKSNQKSKRG